jgi:hypothetical protein
VIALYAGIFYALDFLPCAFPAEFEKGKRETLRFEALGYGAADLFPDFRGGKDKGILDPEDLKLLTQLLQGIRTLNVSQGG